MSEREELYNVLNEFHTRCSNMLVKYINKIDIKPELKKFNSDLYELKEMYKKLEAPNDKDNASNQLL